jgi:spore coat protein U-like protein
MTFRLSWRGRVAAAAALSILAGGALAGTDTDQLTVTATVQSGCALAGGSLDFGQYVSGQPANLDVTGAINFVNCAAGNLTFALDGGGSGNVNSRRMSSGSNKLNYQIFRDPARTANWATGTNAKVTQLLTTQSGKVDVYGRIPGGQTAPAGTYTDTVTVTMTF